PGIGDQTRRRISLQEQNGGTEPDHGGVKPKSLDQAESPLRAIRLSPSLVTHSQRPTTNLFSGVDLRALQLVGVIDVDRLPLGVEINRADATFAMAVAGGFHSAERQVHFRADRGSIDISDAGIEIA